MTNNFARATLGPCTSSELQKCLMNFLNRPIICILTVVVYLCLDTSSDIFWQLVFNVSGQSAPPPALQETAETKNRKEAQFVIPARTRYPKENFLQSFPNVCSPVALLSASESQNRGAGKVGTSQQCLAFDTETPFYSCRMQGTFN
jgi:hypothetical protein